MVYILHMNTYIAQPFFTNWIVFLFLNKGPSILFFFKSLRLPLTQHLSSYLSGCHQNNPDGDIAWCGPRKSTHLYAGRPHDVGCRGVEEGGGGAALSSCPSFLCVCTSVVWTGHMAPSLGRFLTIINLGTNIIIVIIRKGDSVLCSERRTKKNETKGIFFFYNSSAVLSQSIHN